MMDAPLSVSSGCDAAPDSLVNSAAKRNGFAIVRGVLGILLLTAAGLKFGDESLGSDGFGPFASPLGRLAVVEVEALLGIWLLLGLAPCLLWLAALLFFSLLAGVSLFQGIEGQPSCGCFGAKLPVKPWYSFALDLASVAALGWWRPSQTLSSWHAYSATLRQILAMIAGSGLILAVISGGLTWRYGSLYEALPHVRGESITVEPSVSQVGEAAAGEDRTFTILLTNHRDRPIAITGGTMMCSCIATDDLPIIVPPKQSRSVTVRIHFQGRPGRFQHTFMLYTDDENQQTVTARFAGRVMESPSP